jgi:predicted amidophosphoribosyltransferase
MEQTCPRCKATNQYANERCTECGAMLQPGSRKPACPACRVRVRRGTAYCPNCGQPLGRTPSAATPPPVIAGVARLTGGRQCSKCGTLRAAGVAACPECGTRRSRIADPAVQSFWDLPAEQRTRIAGRMQVAAQNGLPLREAAARLFGDGGQPYFREFPQFYDLLGTLPD